MRRFPSLNDLTRNVPPGGLLDPSLRGGEGGMFLKVARNGRGIARRGGLSAGGSFALQRTRKLTVSEARRLRIENGSEAALKRLRRKTSRGRRK